MSSQDLLQAAIESEDPESRRLLVDASRKLALRENILACDKCELRQNATAPVPWRGGPSPLALIGEAPGRQEDMEGKPFVGQAGHFLDSALERAQVEFNPARINSICCRPVGNKYDQARAVGAVDACDPWFWQQIEMSGAWLLVPMGNAARNKFPRTDNDHVGITALRGKAYWWRKWLIMPIFHPAYILRNRRDEDTFVSDLARIRQVLEDDTAAKTELPKGYDPSYALENLRSPRTTFTEKERKLVSNHLRLRGWAMARAHWLNDDIVLVRDEKVKVPEGVGGVVYSVRELTILSHASRNWGDVIHLHNAKKSLGATLVS